MSGHEAGDAIDAVTLEIDLMTVDDEDPPMSAVLLGMGLISFGNLAAFTAAAMTGLWAVFGRGWPLEFFLVAAGLCVVMQATGRPRMLVHLGILLGNGFIFSYCTFTRNWDHWVFLWVFEIWVIAGSIVAAVWLARQRDRSRRLARLIALIVGPLALILSIFVTYASIALGIMSAVLDLIR